MWKTRTQAISTQSSSLKERPNNDSQAFRSASVLPEFHRNAPEIENSAENGTLNSNKKMLFEFGFLLFKKILG